MIAGLPALALCCSSLPPAPSAAPVYQSTQVQTTNENTTTWTGVAIGAAHPKRLVFVSLWKGGSAVFTMTVNGISPCFTQQVSSIANSVLCAFQVPTGTTATIVATISGSNGKAASVWVAYPNNPLPIDSGSAQGLLATNATVSDIKVQANGFVVYGGGQQNAMSTFTTTWNGSDAVTEDVDAIIESGSYTGGRIIITGSTDLSDLVLAALLSATKLINVASWGPIAPSTALT